MIFLPKFVFGFLPLLALPALTIVDKCLLWFCKSFNFVLGVIFSDIMAISSSDDDDPELSSVISPKFRGEGLEVRFPLPKFLGSGWVSTLSTLGVMEMVV